MTEKKDLLQVKINPPPLRPELVSRHRLLAKAENNVGPDGGLNSRLLLCSAPAGFGKTMLAREWMAGRREKTAWFSLDKGDNEPKRFWNYFIAGLQKINGNLGRGSQEILRSGNILSETPAGNEEMLTPLLNDLLSLEEPIYLVLDDYHLVDNSWIHEGMIFFIENMPPSLCLVVTTRSEPPWPLSRWRSKGWIVELRQADIRFSSEETAEFLQKTAEGQVGEEEIRLLYEKTEGWITALQLAAYSIKAHPDAAEFVRNFAGDNRQIFYFLTEEVFSMQPPSVQNFLRETSILARLSASLCDMVTYGEDSREILQHLEKENLFIFPLDHQGNWFRYHPLFADLLHYYLREEDAEKIPTLHRRAGKWFWEAGEPGEAIHHLINGEHYEEAAKVIHDFIEDLWEREGQQRLQEWLETLPRELMEKYPSLTAYQGIISLMQGDMETSLRLLETAEELAYEDEEQQKVLKGIVAVGRTYYNFFKGDLEQGVKDAGEAMELLPETASFWRIFAAVAYGDVMTFSGELESANTAFREAYRHSQQEGNFLTAISAGMNILKIYWLRGELPQAVKFVESLLSQAKAEGFSNMPRVGAAWIFLGELLREEGKLEEAERCTNRGVTLSNPEKLVREVSFIFQAMVYFSRREYQEALQSLEPFEDSEESSGLPDFFYGLIWSWKARINLDLGNLEDARRYIEGVDPENMETVFFPNNQRLVWGRLLLTEKKWEEARLVIDNIKALPHYEKSRRLIIHVGLLECWLAEELGQPEAAEDCLVRALAAGKEGGFYQIFLDEGREASTVFSRLMEGRAYSDLSYKNPGLSAYLESINKRLMPAESVESAGSPSGELKGERVTNERQEEDYYQGLVEDLSKREKEILDLISRGFSNEDISRELYLSVGTVKWHNSNIFGKLGVKNRTQAVARARELSLISSR